MSRYLSNAALIVLVLSGCQSRLNYEQQTTLDPGQIRTIEVEGPRYGRPMTVEVEATESEVNVFVCLDKDHAEVLAAIEAGKSPTQIVGERRHKRVGPIEVKVPPREKAWIFVADAKKSTPLKVKVTGG